MRKLLLLLAVVPLVAACGGSSSSAPSIPTIQAARTFQLAGFEPGGAVAAGKPVTVAFTIQQPNGKPLTNYKRGAGPHTGVHLILVRTDLAAIIHRHPPLGPDGRLSDTIVFPEPARIASSSTRIRTRPGRSGTSSSSGRSASPDRRGRRSCRRSSRRSTSTATASACSARRS